MLVNPAPHALLDLGDNQYDERRAGRTTRPSTTRPSGAPTRSSTRASATPSTTRPDAQGFFDYFASVGVTARIGATPAPTPPTWASGYYSFDIGTWHLIALNSNCAEIGGCCSGSPQETWLKSRPRRASQPVHARLLAPPALELRRPRQRLHRRRAFWTDLYNAHADVVLNGHGNHHYERFAPQTASRHARPGNGVREFIVSTGGESHGTPPGDRRATPTRAQITDYTSFGVLKLTLHPTSYDWQFVPEVGGSFTDSGTGLPPAPAPAAAAPTLSATAGQPVHLSWTAPSDGGAPITGYNSTAARAPGGETLLRARQRHLLRRQRGRNGTKYYYRVAAVNSVGEGTAVERGLGHAGRAPPPPRRSRAPPVLDDFARPAGALGANWQSPGLAGRRHGHDHRAAARRRAASGASSATWSPGPSAPTRRPT